MTTIINQTFAENSNEPTGDLNCDNIAECCMEKAGDNGDEPTAEALPEFADFVRRALLKRFKAVAAEEEQIHDEESPESLHDMRVASRRLRAALRVFQPYLPEKSAKRCAKRVRKLTRGLGASREWDVHAETLAALHAATTRPTELAAIEHVMELVDARRTQERLSLSNVLHGCDMQRLAKDIRNVAERAKSGPPESTPQATAWETLEPMIGAAFDPTPRLRERESAEELHTQRIDVKRLRYAIELLQPLFAHGAERLLARLKHLQEMLGRHHDHVLLEELLARVLSRLTEHGRRTLAEGLVGPIDRLRVERREKYDDYLRATGELTTDTIAREVRAALGESATQS